MMIACTTCKKEFEPTSMMNRKCSKDCYKRNLYRKSKNETFHFYMKALERYFDNPIYQFYRLFHDEYLNMQMKYQIKCQDTEDYLKNWR